MDNNKTKKLMKFVVLFIALVIPIMTQPKTVEAGATMQVAARFTKSNNRELKIYLRPNTHSTGVKRYWYTIYRDGTTVDHGSVQGRNSVEFYYDRPGTYSVLTNIELNDGSRHRTMHPGRWTVRAPDTTGPRITISPMDSGGKWVPRQPFTVTVTDSGSGFDYYYFEYQWDAKKYPNTWSGINDNNTFYTSPNRHAFQKQGIRRIRITAFDKAGNKSIRTSGLYYIDETPPWAVVSPKSRSSWSSSSVTVHLQYADTPGGGYHHDEHVYASGVENAWYRWSKSTATPTSWTKAIGTETYTTQSSSGTWYLHYKVEDKAGNSKTYMEGPYNIDNIKPEGTITASPTGWTNNNVRLSFTGTDEGGSGVRRVRRPNGTWVYGSTTSQTVTSNGTYTFRVEDHAGNYRDISYTVSNIDKTPPTGGIDPREYGWVRYENYLYLYTSDNLSGVSRIRLPNGTWLNQTSTEIRVTSNGTYTFVVEDRAGNQTNVSYEVTNIDRTRPDATIIPNTTNWTNQDVTLTINATDEHSGVRRIRRPNGTWTYNSTTTYTVSSNGTYTFRVEDNIGNTRDVSYTVTNIDKTPPVGVIEPLETEWSRYDNYLYVYGSDDLSGLSRIKLPDGTWVNYDSAEFQVFSNGTYSFVLEDRAGNQTTVEFEVRNIDRTNPTAIITADPNGWTNQDVTLTIRATDHQSGVRRVQIPGGRWIDGDTGTYVAKENSTYSFRVEDNAGNVGTFSFLVNNIDRVAPAETIIEIKTK